MRISTFAALLVGILALAISAPARAQQEPPSVKLSVQTREIYADIPFTLQVTALGFDDSSEPKVSDFEIPGAKLSFLGTSPQVSSQTTIINGVVSRSKEVRYLFAYRVEASKAGTYTVPEIRVSQGNLEATSRSQTFAARDIASTQDMGIELRLPDRPVWLGESFEIDVVWTLRKQPHEQNFVIPIFGHPAFEVEAPASATGKQYPFQVGDQEIDLPYTQAENGDGSSRLEFKAIVTPSQSGSFELEAPRVVAQLEQGMSRNAFGFSRARVQLFKARGEPKKLEVKAPPLSGRPASFSGAVGTGFSIKVAASRSVVSVGEPIELTVTVGAKRGLEGIKLPELLGEGRLDPKLFELIDDESVGQLSEDGKSKTFKVNAVLKSAKATEIPPIEFAYFNPVSAGYETVKSAPIALNVGGASMVGAGDVVAARRDRGTEDAAEATANGSFSGDLSPSAASETLRTVASAASLAPFLGALYVLPLLLLAIAMWWKRTGDSRDRHSHLRKLLKKVQSAASDAQTKPAKDTASELLQAARELARETGNKVGPWAASLEGLAFDPQRNGKPVPAELIDQALAEARSFEKAARAQSSRARGAALVLVLGLSCLPSRAEAAASLEAARGAYTQALQESERAGRQRAFAQASQMYSELAAKYSDRPELLADWGNAALGAGELGTAVLAYRRALSLDKGLERAQRNLAWARSQLPDHLVAESEEGAVDSIFFWHSTWSMAKRHLVAAIAFAVAVLLLLPWGRYRLLRRRVAFVPFVLFAATLGSALLEPAAQDEAVVVADAQTLLAADASGAPAVLSTPLPAGLEVRVEERRGDWRRVRLADGTVGWLRAHGLAELHPRQSER